MTFLIQAPANSNIVSQAAAFASDPDVEKLPMIKMPVVKIPHSAKRKYDDSELATAAVMMEKLRYRDDLTSIGRHNVNFHESQSSNVLDTVIEKLINAIS